MSARIMAEARQQQEEVEAEGDPLRQAAAASGGRWETRFMSGDPRLSAQLSKVMIRGAGPEARGPFPTSMGSHRKFQCLH